MILSLTLLLTIAYSVESASPATPASRILFDYVTGFGVHKIHANRITWNAARNICVNEGAQLAIIDSAAEETMLMNYMKLNNIKSAWIDVHDLYEKKEWTTVMGDRLDSLKYVHWAKGEPNNEDGVEHCVEMNMGGMNDLPCDGIKNAFICEKCPY